MGKNNSGYWTSCQRKETDKSYHGEQLAIVNERPEARDPEAASKRKEIQEKKSEAVEKKYIEI